MPPPKNRVFRPLSVALEMMQRKSRERATARIVSQFSLAANARLMLETLMH